MASVIVKIFSISFSVTASSTGRPQGPDLRSAGSRSPPGTVSGARSASRKIVSAGPDDSVGETRRSQGPGTTGETPRPGTHTRRSDTHSSRGRAGAGALGAGLLAIAFT